VAAWRPIEGHGTPAEAQCLGHLVMFDVEIEAGLEAAGFIAGKDGERISH
jgi:hypothetical protein